MPAAIRTYASPTRLYRFRGIPDAQTLQRELDAIRENYIYCPHFNELNDPMEGVHTESAVLKNTTTYEATLSKVAEAKAKLGIASFSETHRSEPMWAYYASNFSGICIEYSFRTLLRELEAGSFVRVFYNEEPPVLLGIRSTPDERAKLALSSKTVKWAPEREWRLITDKSGPARYVNPKCITRVFLGSRIESEVERKITSLLYHLKIPFSKMNVDRYALTFTTKFKVRKKRAYEAA